MLASIFDSIQKPTLLLNERHARENIAFMAGKARRQGIRFRPHFKTHQSAAIGEWFRAEGVSAITVSSLDMAAYFAENGWDDITLAFPVNWRQAQALGELAEKVRLGLLVESLESVHWLKSSAIPADIWVKIDTGAHRTGLPWDQPADLLELLHAARDLPVAGLLTHAGHTYGAPDPVARYAQSVQRMLALCDAVRDETDLSLQVSVGDTPGCSLSPNLGAVDEIRPGNFIFYDAEQFSFGSCRADQIAVAAACPIVALHPAQEKVVIYGGAIHLSKDCWTQDGHALYGLVALPTTDGWSDPLFGAYVSALSQEHGILHIPAEHMARFQVGQLVCILPAHSCLTAQALGRYQSLDGRWIEMFHSADA